MDTAPGQRPAWFSMTAPLDGEPRSGTHGLFVHHPKHFLVPGEVPAACWALTGCAVSGGDSRCLGCRAAARCCEKPRLRERWCPGPVVKVAEGLASELGWKRPGAGTLPAGPACPKARRGMEAGTQQPQHLGPCLSVQDREGLAARSPSPPGWPEPLALPRPSTRGDRVLAVGVDAEPSFVL